MVAPIVVADLTTGTGLAFALVALVSLAALGWVLTKAIIRASHLEPPAMVTVALSILTLVALGGFILTGMGVLGTLAATGFGAIASAMTNLFSKKARSVDSPEEVD